MKLLRAVLTMQSMAAMVFSAHAFELLESDYGQEIPWHWEGTAINYAINPAGSPFSMSELQPVVQRCFEKWKDAGFPIACNYVGETTATEADDGIVTIFWDTAAESINSSSTTLGSTDFNDGDSATGRIIDQDIALNAVGVGSKGLWRLNSDCHEFLGSPNTVPVIWTMGIQGVVPAFTGLSWEVGWQYYADLESVLTHEIGHLLGLGHSLEMGATMSTVATTPSFFCSTEGASLEADDVAGIQFLYSFGAPRLVTPPDGANNQALLPTFSWTAVAGATAYRLMVSTDPAKFPTEAGDVCAECFLNVTVTSTRYTVDQLSAPALLRGTKFYWIVEAVTGSSSDKRSRVSSFETNPGVWSQSIIDTFDCGPFSIATGADRSIDFVTVSCGPEEILDLTRYVGVADFEGTLLTAKLESGVGYLEFNQKASGIGQLVLIYGIIPGLNADLMGLLNSRFKLNMSLAPTEPFVIELFLVDNQPVSNQRSYSFVASGAGIHYVAFSEFPGIDCSQLMTVALRIISDAPGTFRLDEFSVTP